MTPYYSDDWLTVYQGDCREVMAQMPAESVHTVVTSPPYWGLRDYGTATWLGGDEGCDHIAGPLASDKNTLGGGRGQVGPGYKVQEFGVPFKGDCRKCGAVRQDSQLGLEPTPEEYVANMVAVFREVRRVLRADGTCWVNLGDSYAASSNTGGTASIQGSAKRIGAMTDRKHGIPDGLKPKDLVGIPWRVAFALQADGWYLRSDIIWSKPNPMPESVTDRPTKAHEYLFLLSKSPRYYYDADAVREDLSPTASYGGTYRKDHKLAAIGQEQSFKAGYKIEPNPAGRNLRSVWSIATQPYPGAHFATFPEKLVEPCVKAGTSERGVCPECGAPWRRVVELTPEYVEFKNTMKAQDYSQVREGERGGRSNPATVPQMNRTTGWQPSCAHEALSEFGIPGKFVPATVLDPFAGSGTTGRVAQRLGRRAVLIDLSGEYLVQAMHRNREIPLGLESA